MRRPGSTLAVTLMVTALGCVLAFSLAATGVFELQVGELSAHHAAAAEASEATCMRTLQLLEDNNLQSSVQLNTNSGNGFLTFDPALAAPQGMPASCNNSAGQSSILAPSGQPLAAGCVDLVALGTAGSERALLHVVVWKSTLDYAIAANGPVQGSGLLVSGVAGSGSTSVPGSLLSNTAVTLGTASDVTGDLQSSGPVQLDSTSLVQGEIRSPWSAQSLPTLNAEALDPGATAANLAAANSSTTINQIMRSDASLTVPGDLTLQNGVLFVQGDLTVQGRLSGTGAVLATGSVTFEQGASLSTDDQAAVVCDGNLTLHGGSQFRGLMSVGGTFTASDVTLRGIFIDHATNNAQVTLNNVNLTRDPSLAQIQFTTTTTLGTAWGTLMPASDGNNGAFLDP
ncbi:MAG: hypothetical protein ACYCW6_24370, partial [Candidatus Xenobia bacterium]